MAMPDSVCEPWKVGDLIQPLPQTAKYQNCLLKMRPKDKKSFAEKLVMMGDSIYLVLFKADFTDLNNIKGMLVMKAEYRDITQVDQHRADPSRLRLHTLRHSLSYKSSLDKSDDQVPLNPFDEPSFVDRAALGTDQEPTESTTEIALFFEDKNKAQQAKTFIDYARQRAGDLRTEAVDALLLVEEQMCGGLKSADVMKPAMD